MGAYLYVTPRVEIATQEINNDEKRGHNVERARSSPPSIGKI